MVDTGGFLASTLDISDENFLSGGDLRFKGTSDASVVNLGKISASSSDVILIARTVDLLDDVIPSANAVMAENLLNLSVYFGSSHFEEIALRMIHTLSGAFREHPDSHARWGALCLRLALGSPELVIAGPEAREYSRAVQALFMPSVVRAAATENSRLAPLENRLGRESTQLYICRHRACGPPANSVSEAMQALGTLYDAL